MNRPCNRVHKQTNPQVRQPCLSHSSGFKACSTTRGPGRTRWEMRRARVVIRIACGRVRTARGDVAQLGEHLLCKQGVSGSSPLISTMHLVNRIGNRDLSEKRRKRKSGSSTFLILQRLKSGYRSDKLLRVHGGCLGTKSRRRTRLPAKSTGKLEANVDPVISEWGNPPGVMSRHSRLNT